MSDTSPHVKRVKILSLSAKFLDERRVKALADLDVNTETHLAFSLVDANDLELTRSIVMDNRDNHVEFTLHIRNEGAKPPFLLNCTAYLDEASPMDSQSIQVQ